MTAMTNATLTILENAESKFNDQYALIGLDAYVDQILRVVDKRLADDVVHVGTIAEWGRRIQKAAGNSTKFEMSLKQTKLGGNGPIMANALAKYQLPLTCVGNFGLPDIHPVFAPMKKGCELLSIAQPCFTNAVEFNDGKIMLSQQEATAEISWETLMKMMGFERWAGLFEKSTLIALNNWTSLPHMSDIWERIQIEICPKLSSKPRHFFFDLADPSFRSPEDIRRAMKLISQFSPWFHTTLGLNNKEAGEIEEILGLRVEGKERDRVRRSAEAIRAKLQIEGVVVHATAYAAAASAEGSSLVEGPHVGTPKISTGGGDHFNAGYALGSVLGGNLDECLQLGVATSGFYVKNAQSPTLQDIRIFLREIG
jgi:hypothetical protein